MKNHKNYFFLIGILILLLLIGIGCQSAATDYANLDELGTQEMDVGEVEETEVTGSIDGETWDLLWVSDSSGWGVAEIYGQYIAEDNHVAVNVIDNWVGGLSAGKILQGLKTQDTHNANLDNLREVIAEAEVIVIYGNPEASIDPNNPGDWLCGQPGGRSCYVDNCDMDTFSQYIADMKEIYEIIFEIRRGKATIVRAIDAINPGLISACAPEIHTSCIACWETYNDAIHQAADEMGVPIANAFDAWNGVDHTDDPIVKGYTQEDDIHPNEIGATVIAQLLRELGYDPIVP